MRYYVLYDSENRLIAIGTGDGGIEITEEEYNFIQSEINEKIKLIEQLFNNEITIDDVPVEWQEEIQCRVNEKNEQQKIIEQLVIKV